MAVEPFPPLPLNPNLQGLVPSATLAINERCAALRQQGREVFALGFGQSPFPVPAPVVAALQRHAHRKDYLPVKGLPALREAVAGAYGRRLGFDCGPADVMIGPGSKELIFLLQLVYDGVLLLPTPAWVSYAPQARMIGRRVVQLHTRAEDGWHLTPAQLDAACRTAPERGRLLILNHPSNPTSTAYGRRALQDLAAVARRHRLLVLADEIYGELNHGEPTISIRTYYPEGTIVSGGLSKWCGAGGWRLGHFVFSAPLRPLLDAMAAAASETFSATSTPIQHAAVRAYEGGEEIERYLEGARVILGALGRRLAARLEEAGISTAVPGGGFYLFPDFGSHPHLHDRGIDSSTTLCTRLLDEAGVAALPGSDFGRPAEELTARLAYVNFDGARALAALEADTELVVDDAFLEAYCADTVAAVEKICAWADGAP